MLSPDRLQGRLRLHQSGLQRHRRRRPLPRRPRHLHRPRRNGS